MHSTKCGNGLPFRETSGLRSTGMAFANAMIPGQASITLGESSTDVYINMRWRDYEFYFGDSWKVNRKLTV